MQKTIINNCTDLDDETAIEMVLRVIQKGRKNDAYPYHTKFHGGYHIDVKQTKHWKSDVFWITKELEKK